MDIFLAVVVGIFQLFSALLGIYVSFRPPGERRHVLLVSLFLGLGAISIIIGGYQQYQNKNESRKSETERKQLTGQITTLINTTKIQATGDDITRLSSEIQGGFERVVSAVSGKQRPSQPQQPVPVIQTPVPTIENTRLVQKTTTSDRAEFPYGLQVIIQSNIAIQPVSIALECDGEIGDFSFFIAGQAVYMSVQKTIRGNVAEISFNFPSLTPESPLVVTLLSRAQIKVVKAYKTRR